MPALSGRLPPTRQRRPHFRLTPRPHSVGNSLFLSDGPAGGKYSTSTPAVCSLSGLTERLSPPQGLRDRGEPRKSQWTPSGQGRQLLLGPAWRSTAGGNGLCVGRHPVATLAGEHGGRPCGWIRWDGDCWGAQFCVAPGGWACVHAGQMLGRGAAPLKSSVEPAVASGRAEKGHERWPSCCPLATGGSVGLPRRASSSRRGDICPMVSIGLIP